MVAENIVKNVPSLCGRIIGDVANCGLADFMINDAFSFTGLRKNACRESI